MCLGTDVCVKALASPGIGIALINGILYCRRGEAEDKGMAMRFVVCLSREAIWRVLDVLTPISGLRYHCHLPRHARAIDVAYQG